jgi:inner membrane protein
MASAFSHAIVALTVGKVVSQRVMNWRLLLLGIFCSVFPDIDSIGFYRGVPYGSLWGHRGLTHSLFFALLLSALISVAVGWKKSVGIKLGAFLFLFICTASHGALDAMTNGGLGVAFFSPFNTTRYFSPFRPIAVSPIGVRGFFQGHGLDILVNEFKWVWVPSMFLFLVFTLFQRGRRVNAAA